MLWGLSLDALKAGSWPSVSRLRFPIREGASVSVWLAGAPSTAKLKTVGYVMRRYIDAGLDTRCVRLRELVDAVFDREERKEWLAAFRVSALLVVDLEGIEVNRMVPQVFGEVHAIRSRAFGLTVYLSDDDITGLPGKYGPSMSAAFRDGGPIRRLRPPVRFVPAPREKTVYSGGTP